MGLLVAGTKYRGEFEERLKKLMEEIKQNDDIILVRWPGLALHVHAAAQPRGLAAAICRVGLRGSKAGPSPYRAWWVLRSSPPLWLLRSSDLLLLPSIVPHQGAGEQCRWALLQQS